MVPPDVITRGFLESPFSRLGSEKSTSDRQILSFTILTSYSVITRLVSHFTPVVEASVLVTEHNPFCE